MTKIEHTQAPIDLGTASVETKGSVGTPQPDGSLNQYKERPLGLSND